MSVGLDITGSKRAEEEKRLLIEKREKFSSLKSSISQLPMGNLEKKLARIVEFLADITNAGRVSIVLPELREKWLRIISAYG
ncbi:MAG TPA: hypothetical protein DC049_03265, partial [Spirochaetia bacterium]|nr:hypothetical protein [Spirochaetia bacterium]